MYDIVISGGTVFDGSGGRPVRADVAVADGRIAAIGRLPDGAAAETHIRANGAAVAPGFIDLHTHYDLCLDWPGLSEHCLRQGITTFIGGLCGLGDGDVAGVLARAEAADLGVGFGLLAPLGPLRCRVVPRGEGRPADAAERGVLEGAVEHALDAGALGVSWGPYEANNLMDDAELRAALAPVARRAPASLSIHRRHEGTGCFEATEEAIALARDTGVRLQISHFKAAGRANRPQLRPMLELVEQARRDLDVAVDCYPYDAGATHLSALLSAELLGAGKLHHILADPQGRREAARAVRAALRDRVPAEGVLVLEPSLSRVRPGSDLNEAAEALGIDDPVEAALRLIAAHPEATGGWTIYRGMMEAEDVELVLDLPYTAVGSDALPASGGDGVTAHPRAFGSFARAVGRAANRGEEALADAIRKTTALPAERMGLDRGLLRPGAPADVVVFRALRDRADYGAPSRYPAGIENVLVGGQLALAGGEPTGVRAGTVHRARG